LYCVAFVLLACTPCTAAKTADMTAVEQYRDRGWQAFQRGAFAEAIARWTAAARLYERAGQCGAQSAVLTQLARAYQALGQYRQAEHRLCYQPPGYWAPFLLLNNWL
jgi:tetratricopeptide (TPR) repeat protein